MPSVVFFSVISAPGSSACERVWEMENLAPETGADGLKGVIVDPPEPTFLPLQRVAERQNQTVARLVGQVMIDLADAFEPS